MAIECKHGQLARSCEICELEAENVRLRAENERLRTVLQSVEYVEDADGVWWCPSCKVCHHDHSDNCQLKAALDAAGGE